MEGQGVGFHVNLSVAFGIFLHQILESSPSPHLFDKFNVRADVSSPLSMGLRRILLEARPSRTEDSPASHLQSMYTIHEPIALT